MATLPEFYATAEAESPEKAMKKKTQRLQILKVFVIALIAALTAIFIIMDVVQTGKKYSEKIELRRVIDYSIETASVIHHLQKERGFSALFITQKSWNTKENRDELALVRNDTNRNIAKLRNWKVIHVEGTEIHDSDSFFLLLQTYRKNVKYYEGYAEKHLHSFSHLINELISWLSEYTASKNLENFAEDVFAYQMIIHSKEEAALERFLGSIYYLQGTAFTSRNISWYNTKRIRAETFLETAFQLSRTIREFYASLKRNCSWCKDLHTNRELLASGRLNTSSQTAAREWFNIMTKYNIWMLKLQVQEARRINQHLDNTMSSSTQWLVIRSFLLVFALFVVPLLIISLVRVQNAFYQYTISLYDKVGLEQGRTEFLMRENARHVENLASRWKNYSNDAPQGRGRHPQVANNDHPKSKDMNPNGPRVAPDTAK